MDDLSALARARYDPRSGVWRAVPGSGERARALLAAGAPVEGAPGARETPLITAASYGDADVARALVEAGARLEAVAAPDAGGVPGGTALVHAAVFGMTEVVDVLVAAGAEVSGVLLAAAGRPVTGLPAGERTAALVMAAHHQRLPLLDDLVAAGVPVDAVDPVWGRQALRVAAGAGRAASVARLLRLGADPSSTDSEGRSALDLCRREQRFHPDEPGYAEVERLLSR